MFITMMLWPLLIWLSTLIFTVILGVILCYKVEKSGVKRWGATGKLFKY